MVHWVIQGSILVFLGCVCLRESAAFADSIGKKALLSESTVVTAAFESLFYRALNKLSHGDGQGATDDLAELSLHALQAGYTDLPTFSRKLLDAANSTHVQSRPDSGELIMFYVRRATELSPFSSEIQFAAAGYSHLFGLKAATGFLIAGVRGAFSESRSIAVLAANAVFIGLLSLILSLFLVCIVQFAVGSDLVLRGVEAVIPVPVRGLFAPFALLLMLCVPLLGGLWVALAVWTIMLSALKSGCRWFAVLAGLVLMAWSLLLPEVARISSSLRDPLEEAIDRANTGAYVATDLDVLLAADQALPGDPVVQFSLAKLLITVDPARSRNLFRLAEERVIAQPRAVHAVRMNIAVLDHLNGDFSAAKAALAQLEQAGVESFELFFNLAFADLVLTEMEGHRSSYEKVLAIDGARMRRLEAKQQSFVSPFSVGLPQTFRLRHLYYRGQSAVTTGEVPVGFGWKEEPLFVSAILVLAGIWILLRARPQPRWGQVRRQDPSGIWLLLPGGYYTAGDNPLRGFILSAGIIGATIVAFEHPVSPISISDLAIPLASLAKSAGLGLTLLAALLPVLTMKREQKVSK